MITTSDLIRKLIKDKGYKTIKEFCEKNNINYLNFKMVVFNNSWSKKSIDYTGEALGVDLSKFINAYVGVSKSGKWNKK